MWCSLRAHLRELPLPPHRRRTSIWGTRTRTQDEQVQAFIRDGVILIPPELPEWYHAHIHRRCSELGMDGPGLNPGSTLLAPMRS
jgi:hypothetical protein